MPKVGRINVVVTCPECEMEVPRDRETSHLMRHLIELSHRQIVLLEEIRALQPGAKK